MKTDNDTNQPVDYDQTGDGQPFGKSPCKGTLAASASRVFPPCGQPPWVVTFTLADGRKVSSRPLVAAEAGATVTLRPDETVVVA